VEKTYTLRMRCEDICEIQERERKSFGELLGSLTDLDYVTLRKMVWQFLQPHHKAEFQTPQSVMALIDDAFYDPLVVKLHELYTLNKPPKKDIKTNPRRAQGGTGANSTSSGAGSV
jgi:hypothetical protein